MRKVYWTKERVWQEARRYGCYTEFVKDNPTLYRICRLNKWIEELKALLPGRYGKWTYEQCLEEARQCASHKDFVRLHRNTYNIARYHGWLASLKADNPQWTINRKS